MKKYILFVILLLCSCASTNDFGVSVKGENIKKTICWNGGINNLYFSAQDCINKAKAVCPIIKTFAMGQGYSFNGGYFYEILFICG